MPALADRFGGCGEYLTSQEDIALRGPRFSHAMTTMPRVEATTAFSNPTPPPRNRSCPGVEAYVTARFARNRSSTRKLRTHSPATITHSTSDTIAAALKSRRFIDDVDSNRYAAICFT